MDLWKLFELMWPWIGSAVIALLVALLAMLVQAVKDYLRSQSRLYQRELWYKVAYQLVTAAEQWLPDDPGDKKYAWVAPRLKAAFPFLADEQIREIVEAAVFQMNNALKDWPEPESAGMV